MQPAETNIHILLIFLLFSRTLYAETPLEGRGRQKLGCLFLKRSTFYVLILSKCRLSLYKIDLYRNEIRVHQKFLSTRLFGLIPSPPNI